MVEVGMAPGNPNNDLGDDVEKLTPLNRVLAHQSCWSMRRAMSGSGHRAFCISIEVYCQLVQ